MVDEFKSIRDGLFKTLTGLSVNIRGSQDDEDQEQDTDQEDSSRAGDARAARALISAIFARAGKSKDEIVQIIAREIGLTVAAMLKEPLSQIAKHQKLQISFELIPKKGEAAKNSVKDHPSKKIPSRKHPRVRRRAPRSTTVKKSSAK